MEKIIVISTDLTGGGAERVATNLASCLAEKKDVTLVLEHISNDTYGTTVNTINLNMPFSKGKFKVSWHLLLAKKLRAVKKELGVTHSISFLSEPSLANVLSKKNDYVIVSERNYLSAKKSRILRIKEKWLLKNSDMVVSLSEMVRQDIVKNYGVEDKKTITIYNPCYVENIHDQIKNGKISYEESIFLKKNKGKIAITAGRLTDQKAQWHLIRAFFKVVKKIPDAKLIVLGQGENEQYLRKLISDLNLDENVFLWGYKKNPYVYLARADLFVFSSLFEGLGNIIVECMACGLPVISTDCKYGPKELLGPGTNYKTSVTDVTEAEYGILVPPIDGVKYEYSQELTYSESKIAEAIVTLINDKELREKYRQAIQRRSLDFKPEVITDEWLNLIK